MLSCIVTGTPPPSVQWSLGRQILKHSAKYKISSIGEEHFLEILSLTVEDTGQYTCSLCNPVGTTSATCQLVVGEATHDHPRSSSHRSLLKNRYPVDAHGPLSSTDSDITDKSSLDGEIFYSHAPVTSGIFSQPSAIKRSSEPFVNKNINSDTYAERKVSAPVSRNPDISKTNGKFVEVVNRTPVKVDVEISRKSDSPATEVSKSPVLNNSEKKSDTFRQNRSKFVENVPKTVKKSDDLVIEKKGGITQVDFRGVLKNKQSKVNSLPNVALDQNGHSNKLLNNKDLFREASNESKKISSPKSQFVESRSDIKSNPRSVHVVQSKDPGNKPVGKISEALRKFEENSENAKTDYKSVLKGKTTTDSNSEVKLRNTKSDGQNSQLDFRSVLKKKEEVKSASFVDKDKKFKLESINKDSLNNTSFENKSIQKQRAELVLNVRKKSFEIPRSPKVEEKKSDDKPNFAQSYTEKRGESNFEVQSVKPKVNSGEKELTEFRSVLVKSDRVKAKDNPNQSEIIRPIPRRLSQSKGLSMDKLPNVEESLKDTSVDYGSEVTLTCHVTGVPQPDISWTINNKEIKQSKFFRMSYMEDRARLVIAEAFSEDEGDYTCTASNTLGSVCTTCHVNVKERACTPENIDDSVEEPFSPTATPPKIYNISPSEFCILRGGSIEFKASYTSVPQGTVTWCKNKQEIQSDDRCKIETSECFSTLIIQNIQPSDSGKFDLKVTNKLGSDVAHASLTVEDVPEPPVGKPWVSEVSLRAATLSWYGPAYDGGCPIINYRVEMCDAEEEEWQLVTCKCASTTCRIEKLQPQTPYFFRVFAENKHGLSDPCMTPEVTVTSDRRPSALLRLPSTESDEEISFEHREVSLLPGRTFESYYDCLQEVGKGKFGSVYKCEEKSTGKIWAAKILKCRESEKKKIHLEVEIMNKLKHPKILMLWDVFEAPRKIILIMEYIGGGELFERVIDDDFELTERDCIQFMRQICDAVNYMHGRNILHLDLKPENILCIKNESNKIKIIDFGLARYYNKGESVRVLFGTPEFIAPEVVNYDEIDFRTDMWSIGVICYVLLTGLSPFMGDSDAETLANVTNGEFDFDEEEFDSVSQDGKNFIEKLLVKNKLRRLNSLQALEHAWLAEDAARLKNRRINTKNLKRFMARRKWQKTGNAIRALGRMRSSLQKLLPTSSTGASGDSMSSASGLGSASSTSSMSSSGSQNALSELIHSPNSLKVTPVEEEDETHHTDEKNSSNGKMNESSSKNLDMNLNVTNQNKNSAFVRNVSRNNENGEKLTDHVDSCNGCSTDSSSNQTKGFDSKNRFSDAKNRTKVGPKFCKEMVDSKAFPGDVVRFDVEFNGDKSTSAAWYFEDEVLHEDGRHSIQTSGDRTCSLIIKDVCEDDDGEYSCKITNQSGEDVCSAELIVYGAL
ncbi:hypothetical protein ACF0H5_023367 [Mactra antiquata]